MEKKLAGGARNLGRVHFASAFAIGIGSGPSGGFEGWGKGSFLGVIVSCVAVSRHFLGVIGIWMENPSVHLTPNVILGTACRHERTIFHW